MATVGEISRKREEKKGGKMDEYKTDIKSMFTYLFVYLHLFSYCHLTRT